MEIGRWFKQLLVLLAIVIITFQPVFVPTVYAVSAWTGDSWTGDSWEGDPWEGDPWDGSDLKWKGKDWTGEKWQGEGTQDGSSWDGNDWDSVPWYLKGWQLPGYNGSVWSQAGFQGNTFSGNPWAQSGFFGNAYTGNPWTQAGFMGNAYNGNPWTNPAWAGLYGMGNPWMANGYLGYPWLNPAWTGDGSDFSLPQIPHFYDSEGFQIGEYVVKDVINGQAGFINAAIMYQDALDNGSNAKFNFGSARSMFGNMVVNGMKLGVGSNFITESYDMATHVEDGINAVKDLKKARELRDAVNVGNLSNRADQLSDVNRVINTGDTLTDITKMGALSKLNVGVAALGTGVSAVKTYNSIGDAVDTFNSDATGAEKTAAVADVGANLGDTLMNAGVVTAAIPGGQVVGAGMAAVGAGIWVVSKGVKLFANNWKGNLLETTKEIGKKAAKGIKKGWETVKGWFS